METSLPQLFFTLDPAQVPPLPLPTHVSSTDMPLAAELSIHQIREANTHSTVPNVPLHLGPPVGMFVGEGTQTATMDRTATGDADLDDQDDGPMECFMNFFSSLFQVPRQQDKFTPLPTSKVDNDKAAEEIHARSAQRFVSLPRKPTAPIKVGSQGSLSQLQQPPRDSFEAAHHKRQSAPIGFASSTTGISASRPGNSFGHYGTSDGKSPPLDYVHPEDGHLWRAKYCVLEDGVLYFYRNPTDAHSPEAMAERKNPSAEESDHSPQQSTQTNRVKELSKSPMTRGVYHLASSSLSDGHLWEKRVFLDSVGAVRSAEHEYGKNAFELLAVQDMEDEEEEEDVHRLILQARNTDEMNDWIFQFHRSLASFLINLVGSMGTVQPGVSFDIHHPIFMHQSPTSSDGLSTPSPRQVLSIQS